MSFKKLVIEISRLKTLDDLGVVIGHIDRSYEAGKISWEDHEMLVSLAGRVQISLH